MHCTKFVGQLVDGDVRDIDEKYVDGDSVWHVSSVYAFFEYVKGLIVLVRQDLLAQRGWLVALLLNASLAHPPPNAIADTMVQKNGVSCVDRIQ